MKRRIVSVLTALALMLNFCPTWALAAADGTDDGRCAHRPSAWDRNGAYTVGADTGPDCPLCPIEALIAALPEQVTEDNAGDVRAQLDKILALYGELTEDEQEQISLSRIYALQGALDAANVPDPIAESVNYRDASWDGSAVAYTTKTAENCTPVTSSATKWNAGWYVVNQEVTITTRIKVSGEVRLILADGCTLHADNGIDVPNDSSLTIYGQESGTGQLTAKATEENHAGIGGRRNESCGTITINSGTVEATGGGGVNGGAGIGSAYSQAIKGSTVIINGGTVTATGGGDRYGGAGIGGARGSSNNTVTINGGTVTATGVGSTMGGAGIGGSYECFTNNTVTINGGEVIATGGPSSDGIGNCHVTITGGTVTATKGESSGKDITDDKTITGGTVNGTTYCTVTFLNGRADVAEVPPQTLVSGEKATEPDPRVLEKHIRTWYTDQGLTNQFNFDTPVTEKLTLYAKWEKTEDYIASVTQPYPTGGVQTIQYTSLSAAWASLQNQTSTLKLLKDVTTSQTLTVSSGMNVTVKMDGNVTLTNNSADCFKVDGGALTLASGTVVEGGSGKSVVYAASGTLNVEGGTYRSENGNCLYVEGGVRVQLSGGTLHASGIALHYGNRTVKEMLAAEYAIFDGGSKLLLSRLNGTELAGGSNSYTVAACGTHDLQYTDQNNGTHINMCIYCGYFNEGAEQHSYDDNGKCQKCGFTAQAKVAVGSNSAVYYETLSEAWNACSSGTCTITLLKDAHTDGILTVSSGDVTVEMANGATLTAGTENCFKVTGGTLTLTESCKVEKRGSGNSFVDISSGNLYIKGGTYVNRASNGNGVWAKDAATVQISGGTFTVNKDMRLLRYKTKPVSGMLAKGYGIFNSSGSLVADLNPNELKSDGGAYTVKPCTHVFDGTGICPVCGKATTGVAKVTTGETTTYYEDILSAWNAVDGKTATLTLLKIADLGSGSLDLTSGDVTLEMAEGVELTGSSGNAVVRVTGGKLTLKSGTIENTCNDGGIGLQASGGDLEITGGTVEGSSAVLATTGTVKVTGGTFTGTGSYGVGLQKDGAWDSTVRISGGTFTGGGKGVLNAKAGETLADLLAEGYAFKRDDVWADTSGDSLTGTVTVEEAPVKITEQPQNATGTYGEWIALNLSTEPQDGSILYQWYRVGEDGDTPVAADSDNAGNNPHCTPQGLHAGEHRFYCVVSHSGYKVKSKTVTVTVKRKQLTPSITGTTTKIYNGTTDCDGTGLSILLDGLLDGDINKVTAAAERYAYDTADAGEHKAITASGITLDGDSKDDYTLFRATATANVGTIHKAEQTAPAAPTAAEVKDTSITLTAIENAEYSKDGTNWQASPTFTGLVPNTAYTFYARLKGDDNHNPSSASAGTSITTKKMMLDDATVTVSGSYTYTGAAQTPAVTVVKNGKTLTAGTDYTVVYANNTNAGTATVTITGMGDYEGTNSTTFTIERKTLTVAGAAAQNRQYDGTNMVKITAVALEGVVTGDGVSVNTENLSGTIGGTDAGSYAAVTLPALNLTGEKADNYTLTRPAGAVSASVTISKADALTPKTGDLAVANGRAHTYTYGLGALRPDVPEGMSLGSAPVTYTLGTVSLGSYYGGSGAKIEGQTLTLPIAAVDNDEAKGIGTITVTIKSDNFEDMTAAINVRSVNKIIPTGGPTLSAATLTYGQPLSAITLSGSMMDGNTPVPGTFAWSSPDNRPAVQEKYAAAWTFTPDDNGKYAIVNGTAILQVLPAPITGAVIALEPAAFRQDGAAHIPTIVSVTLNGITLTADVDYTAQIPEGTEAGTYTVTLTGIGSYTGTATAAFTVNPVEQKPLDQTDNDGHELRLEVETGLSTVPAVLENDARYDTPKKIETALRTRVEQAMSNVGENIAVFDVTLQYKDASGTWRNVDPKAFPEEGVTAILPYPDGTGATGYTFTVQHLISSGDKAGEMETLTYTLTADGLKCKFSSLSPVAIGYEAASKPGEPADPAPTPPSGGGFYWTGGGSGVSTYAVTVEKSEHGKVTASAVNAAKGSAVTLTVTPDEGYVLETLTVTGSGGKEVQLTAQGGGKYVFTMPGRAVTVKASFAPLPEDVETVCDGGADCPSRGFTDLGSVGTWYHEAVDYVLRNGLMGGYASGLFGPNDTLTRAQFAQILYNKEGRPAITGGSIFTDVASGAWYTEAVRWATSQGIVGGYGNGKFGPNDHITREQLAVMLWRYAGSPAATNKELHFNDTDEISGFALEAMRWAVEKGVVNGKGGGILDPKGLATRAQAAEMLRNFLGK